jgi:hypothetical protein
MIDIKTDPETGLPEVPEGYFWKVEKQYGRMPYVTLRRRYGKLFGLFNTGGSYKVGEKYIVELTEGRIREGSYKVFREVFDSSSDHLLGEYPPKKLGRD